MWKFKILRNVKTLHINYLLSDGLLELQKKWNNSLNLFTSIRFSVNATEYTLLKFYKNC